MPTVLRIGPYRFFFFSRETGEPPHIHIAADDKEAKVWLGSHQLASSYGFRPHELTEILLLVMENSNLLQEAWNEFFSHKS